MTTVADPNEQLTATAVPTPTEQQIELVDHYSAHNYHPLPVVVAEAEGAWVTDVEGKHYLDMLAAYSALNFGHRHPDLIGWARENRGRLVHAALTLIRAWISRGRPAGTETMGSYESWARVMGGILGVANVPGLLLNRDAFRRQAVSQTSEWSAFVSAWWDRYGNGPVGVKELFEVATARELFSGLMGDGNERSQRSRLGSCFAPGMRSDGSPRRATKSGTWSGRTP